MEAKNWCFGSDVFPFPSGHFKVNHVDILRCCWWNGVVENIPTKSLCWWFKFLLRNRDRQGSQVGWTRLHGPCLDNWGRGSGRLNPGNDHISPPKGMLESMVFLKVGYVRNPGGKDFFFHVISHKSEVFSEEGFLPTCKFGPIEPAFWYQNHCGTSWKLSKTTRRYPHLRVFAEVFEAISSDLLVFKCP